jgi:two-component system, cell cycle sensor histidine kinase and response regulator CckA
MAFMSSSERRNVVCARLPDEWAGPPQAPREATAGSAAPAALRILMLEDEPSDAELGQRLLRSAGLNFTAVVVDSKEAFVLQLDVFCPEVVLSDFSLAGFSGESALELTRRLHPHVPFVFLSGVLGDEQANELLRLGATDYVLKDRPARLAAVVRRAVSESEERAKRVHLETELQLARRLENLGQMTGGVAQDLNSLLGVISNCTSSISQEIAQAPRIRWQAIRADITEIDTTVRQATHLTRQLLALRDGDLLQPRVLSINDMVADVAHLLMRALGDIELETVLTADPGLVYADRGQLARVLVNLAVSASDVMRPVGKLTIETANVLLDEADAAQYVSLQPGSYVGLRVADTSTEVPPELISQIFEPFVSSSRSDAGTGRGITTVYGMVTRAGGTVRIDSETGQGTIVTILLPAVGEITPQGADPGGAR